MITRLIWTPMSSVPEKADKLALSLAFALALALSLWTNAVLSKSHYWGKFQLNFNQNIANFLEEYEFQHVFEMAVIISRR